MRPAHGSGTRYSDHLARLLRARAPSIVAFVGILMLFDLVRSWSVPGHGSDAFFSTLSAFPWAMTFAAALAPTLVEATGLRGIRLATTMTLVTLALVGATGLLVAALASGPIGKGVRDGLITSNEAFLYRGWWVYSVAGLLFAAYCQTREREQEVLRAAREAELVRADAQREIVASRLKVLQARVEPELLFEALADVRATYLRDPAVADALLDDLVAYLRAALPQMRGGASTLAREAMLAEAYLRVVPAGREGRLHVEVAVPERFADEDFPPMVLLPLVNAVADAGASQLRIVVTSAATSSPSRSLDVAIPGSAVPAGWNDEPLHVIRETLLDYLGKGATLTVVQNEDSTSATVRWVSSRTPPSAPPEAVSSAESTDSSPAS